MPALGLGTAYIGAHHGAARANPAVIETPPAIGEALDMNYTMLDLGSELHPAYGNEALVGRLLLERGGVVRRRSVFLTSKLSPNEHGFDATLRGIQRSLSLLGTDTLDLFLIHHPMCLMAEHCEGTWRESWRAMEFALEQGAVRAIGVSNFNAPLLRDLLAFSHSPVALLQNRADPLQSEDPQVLALCQSQGVQFQSFSTLGRQWVAGQPGALNPVLAAEPIQAAAAALGRTPAQITLRWALDQGWAVVPKSSQTQRLESNRRVFDGFELPHDTRRQIDLLSSGASNARREL